MNMVKANGENVHTAITPTYRCCQARVYFAVDTYCCTSLEVGLCNCIDSFWSLKVVKRSPKEVVWNRAKCVSKIKEENMTVSFIPSEELDLLPNHACVFYPARKTHPSPDFLQSFYCTRCGLEWMLLLSDLVFFQLHFT